MYHLSDSVYSRCPLCWYLVRVKVKKPNLAIELSSYAEQQNMWVGPRQVSAWSLFSYYST